MTLDDAKTIYETLRDKPTKLNEEIHCPMIINIMADPERGRYSAFCTAVKISEDTFYNWIKRSPMFAMCYSLGKMHARENWEYEGMELRNYVPEPGEGMGCRFEHWRMMGWSRFGVGKNSRIRLDLDPEATPDKHYAQLLDQAGRGDYTAGEIKQLMEAINVGLNTHQVIALQKQVDELKSDLLKMSDNRNVQNSFTDTGIAQKD